MGSNTVKVTADKLKRRDKSIKYIKILILILILFLLIIYFILSVVYKGANFTISLDPNLTNSKGIVLYNDFELKNGTKKLYIENEGFMDNISIDWLPNDINNNAGGSHNGDNYIAYTFYIENQGEEVINYWYEVNIDDVIKNVDEAVRIRVYKDGESVTYAKISSRGTAEPDTVPFESDELIVREHIINFEPGKLSKYTIVLWIEGSDPECTDNILGGEFKVHMDFKSENTEEGEGLDEKKK